MPAATSGVVLTVLAVVLGGDGGGAAGEGLRIDKGLLDGLRPGDRGAVHYVLTVGADERRIPAGEAVVTTVAPHDAAIEVTAERPVHPGYRVAFELSPERLAPASLAAAAEHLPEDERQRVMREIVETRVLGDDEDVRRLLLDALPTEASGARPEDDAPPRSLDSGRSAPSARDDAGASAGPPAPSEPQRSEGEPGMLLIPAGTYAIGLPSSEAGFYNQQPRFEVFLEAFWIDAEPVRLGFTYAEAAAFCRRLGKRLPTELEWEAAVTTADGTVTLGEAAELDLSTPGLEWTASWYGPYAGNPVSEAEYGERYRVLRGAREGEPLSPHRRRFMAPDARHPQVGFRCVLDP